MTLRSIVQRTFLRGVNAAVSKYDQPRGSLPRLSNLYLILRGTLSTLAGNKLIVDFGTRIAAGIDWIFHKFQGTAQGFYYAWANHHDEHITTPLPALTLTGINTTGGLLIPTVEYFYQLVACSLGGTPSGQIDMTTLKGTTYSLVLPGGMNAIRVEWTGAQDTASYVLFIASSDNRLTNLIPNVPGTVLSHVDLNHTSIGSLGIVLDQSKVSRVYKSGTGAIAKFPFALFNPLTDDATNYLNVMTAAGGVVGNISSLARFLPFVNKLLLIGGNGWPIYSYDGTTFTKISNTFTAQYATWQTAVTWLVGDYVVPTVPNTFYYKCVQSGLSAAGEPVWPTVVGQRVADKQVIWECVGLVSTSPAPPGAAFAITHAGSLWVWNTYPTNTADGLDGPSALRMSDVNNPLSWNPINAAFIDKDDGTQGMGLASFTIAESGIAPIGSLILFKSYSAYQVVGVFGSPNFAIQRVQTDMGCLAPDTILFVPGFGIMRLSHLGFAVFDGVRDRLVSEEIRPYLFQSVSDITAIPFSTIHLSRACLVANPPLYICAAKITDPMGLGVITGATRVFIFDLVLRAWTIADVLANSTLQADIGSSPYMGVLRQVRAAISTPAQTAFMSFEGGKLYRWFGGDTKWYQAIDGTGGTDISWTFTTPEVFTQPSVRAYFRSMYIRGVNTSVPSITVTIYLQGESGITTVGPQTINLGSGEFELKVDIGETVLSAKALVSGQGVVQIESVEWFVADKPPNVPARIT